MKSDRLTKNSRGTIVEVTGPFVIGLVSLVLALFGAAGREALRFDRTALAAGELWRLVTGHLVHLGPGHVVLNLAGLAVLAFVFWGIGLTARWWSVTTLASAAAIDAGLLALQPGLDWYVGLSGVLHGIWAAGAAALFRSGDAWYAGVLALVLAGKLVAEQLGGPSEWTQSISGGDVVAAAHLYGAAGGIVAALWLSGAPKLIRRLRKL